MNLNRQEIPQEEIHSYWRSSDRILLREKTTVSELSSSHMEDYFYFYYESGYLRTVSEVSGT